MLRIFLVEDESNIRENLRDTVPWERCGYTFVGEAADGEMALPLIRQTKPDVLVTDIRMPFMDGLALSKVVLSEFPDTKIIILSGYDDFQYAQQAIRLGVERYLLKPITKAAFMSALQEVREKIEAEQEARHYASQFHQNAQEYEQFARRSFVEALLNGSMSVGQVYEQAAELDIDLIAQSYCLAMFSIQTEKTDGMEAYSDTAAQVREALLKHFLMHPEYLLMRWSMTTYLVILKGDASAMDGYVNRCIGAVRQGYETVDPEMKWYLAVGTPTERISSLRDRYEELSRLWSCRYIFPDRHILTADTVGDYLRPSSNQGLNHLDPLKCNPAILMDVLKSASREEIPGFADTFLAGVREGLSSAPFCSYLMLSVRFTATEYVTSVLQQPQEALLEGLTCLDMVGKPVIYEDMRQYLTEILGRAIDLRDKASTGRYRTQLGQAIAYIDEHFAEETLSLNRVAQEINISPNYLSAVFSQETGATFVEYVTKKRMARARELLRTTDMRSGEVAAAVGYRDPHYFSFLFRKTQGCTPRDYRNGGK